jgi:hypothetical protein
MVGIPMDGVGAGMLECGCYSTANGIAFRGVVWGTLCTLNPSVVPNFSPRSGFLCALYPLRFSFRGVARSGCNRGGCVGYTSGAVINHLLKRGMDGAGIVRRIPAPRCVMGC